MYVFVLRVSYVFLSFYGGLSWVYGFCACFLNIFVCLLWFYGRGQVGVRHVGMGGGELRTLGVLVSDRRLDSRRRLLRTLRGRKFRVARTALDHSLGLLGMTGTTSSDKGCTCILPGSTLCGHIARPVSVDGVKLDAKFRSVGFSNGVMIVGAQPKCTDDVTCGVSGDSVPRVLKAVTKSSAVFLIGGGNAARRRVVSVLSRIVPRLGRECWLVISECWGGELRGGGVRGVGEG